MGRFICLDTEYDARYSDRGVSRLSCMTLCERGKAPTIHGYRDAAALWVELARDPSVRFLTHGGWNDFAVLADEAHLLFEGELPQHPGLGPYWELAHKLYDEGRVYDTETAQRLTHIRFGPHKLSVRLGDLLKYYFGEDASDSKTIPAEAQDYLRRAVPYDEWPEELEAKTPWRVKFGMLRERYGNDVDSFPIDAVEYALGDAEDPWRFYDLQRDTWQRRIPDLGRQIAGSWMLHLVSIPGWKADRERAQSIRGIYARCVDKCTDVLLDAGILEEDGPRDVQKADKLKGLVFAALGTATGVTKSLADRCKKEQREPTLTERRECAATDARACMLAITAAGGPDMGKTPKPQREAVARLVESHESTLALLRSGESWAPLLAHVLRAKLADAAPGTREAELRAVAREVLLEAGVLEVVHKFVKKETKVRQRIYAQLGDAAKMTDKGYEQFGNDPTPQQRFQFAATDSKAVRAAILAKDATPLEIADAVERSELGDEEFFGWLQASGERELNALAVRSKASKTIGDFIDKLNTDRRIRTTYKNPLDTGRTSSRGSGGPGTLNVQQLPRDYDKPKHLHVRGCIVPDPGWCFIVADYTQLELCALAYILTHLVRSYARDPVKKKRAERLLGFPISTTYESTLQSAINNDQDCHVRMAAVLRSSTYDECIELYKVADDKKERGEQLNAEELQMVSDRQLAKPCNFGFPGGLGAPSFVDYAAGYGVAISQAVAAEAYAAYMKAWPEMQLYFWHIKQKIKDAEKRLGYGAGGVCVQVRSKRERGDCSFTQWSNGWFQGLASDGAKEAGRRLVRGAYREPECPMFGTRPSGFIHDEYLVNSPIEIAKRALPEVERRMVAGMEQWIPGVKIKAPGKILYERWGK